MMSQAILMAIILLLATEINSASFPLANCPTSCGNLTIPFPFGTSSDCNLDDSFLITCNHSYNPPKAFLNLGRTEVLEISLDGLIKVSSSIASDCYDSSGTQINGTISELTLSKFPVSNTRNKFAAVGCDTYALIEGSEDWKQMSAGCVSWCDTIDSVVNGTCSGIGCCQTSIPQGMKDFLVDVKSFRNHTRVKNFNPCGYAFVVESDSFEFSSLDLKDFQTRKTVPTILDWSVGNLTCQEARTNLSTYACRAIHSECSDSRNGNGYHCNCLTGFQGNPYLVDGCLDIDECTTLKPCERTCTNLQGSYSCSCPKGLEGDGKKDGSGCHRRSQIKGSTLFYITSGFMVPAVGSSWIFWRRKQKKVIKLRKNLFRRNGGVLLENMLSRQRTLVVFTAEDLKKATDNYDENKILRRELHSGITYIGILPDGGSHSVSIKKFDAIDECNIEVFVSKLVALSSISHKNIVKLIGCCLETQVPLLVHEFITAKTLYSYIHNNDLSWDIRLNIAAQTAGALYYMHSAAAVPIIHGNLTSSTILVQHGYIVKVGDFALACNEIADVRYLDHEYFISGRLTEKSDVYSFGLVLGELLTGKTTISNERPGVIKHLSEYFVSLSLGGDDFLEIVDHRLLTEGKIEQIKQVAKLAKRCLSNSSSDRPTMREVVIALESAMSLNSSSTTISPNASQTTTTRRVVRRNRSF